MYRWMVARAKKDIRLLRQKKPEAMASMYKVLMDAQDRLDQAEREAGKGRGPGDERSNEELEEVIQAADNVLRFARDGGEG